jgi:hypothetical protein
MKTLAYSGWRVVNGKRRWVTVEFLGGHLFEFRVGWFFPAKTQAVWLSNGRFNDFVDATLTWM